MKIVGTKNAGFEIITAEHVNGLSGYCIGRSATQYVTWYFTLHVTNEEVDFYHGHYIPIDQDSPYKSACRAKADYHRRMMEALESIAKYGG